MWSSAPLGGEAFENRQQLQYVHGLAFTWTTKGRRFLSTHLYPVLLLSGPMR
jgi:hypothetical protein